MALVPVVVATSAISCCRCRANGEVRNTYCSVLALAVGIYLTLNATINLVFIRGSNCCRTLDANDFAANAGSVVFFTCATLPNVLTLLSVIPVFGCSVINRGGTGVSGTLTTHEDTRWPCGRIIFCSIPVYTGGYFLIGGVLCFSCIL